MRRWPRWSATDDVTEPPTAGCSSPGRAHRGVPDPCGLLTVGVPNHLALWTALPLFVAGLSSGAAIGAAVLAAVYRVTLDGHGVGTAGAVTFLASAGFAVLALVVAVRQLLADGRP